MVIFWFKNDLRLADNPALSQAAKNNTVMPIFILDNQARPLGRASKWWLFHSLNNLNQQLNGKLNIYQGNSEEIIAMLIKRYNVEAFHNSPSLLWSPEEILKADKTPYKVYTPFKNACLKAKAPRRPIAAPQNLVAIKDEQNSYTIEQLNLLATDSASTTFYQQLEQEWQTSMSEEYAQKQLIYFLDHKLQNYKINRDFPFLDATSKLSAYLHFGQISVNQVWYAANNSALAGKYNPDDLEQFLNEIIWREFAYHLLHHFPTLPKENFRSEFDAFPWRHDEKSLQTWQLGMTGYPIIDAGMRQLRTTGHMHNRVRMIVSSFLVKNLLIDWRAGEAWFWEYLLDADLANNIINWQWVAGCGVDAAPYFRIFNPTLQSEKFDVQGEYIRKFVPKLAKLPTKYLFQPWEAPPEVLRTAGIELGIDYPIPIIGWAASRERALKALKETK